MIRRPRLYFSFRSPYSWLTVHRLRAAVPGAFEALDWYPYWDPDAQTSRGLAGGGATFHYVQMSRAKHLYMLTDTKRLAQQLDLRMAWPIDVEPWWERPHLAWLVARRAGLAEPFYDAVIKARWGRGENICDPAVIRAAAERVGLDPERALAGPADPGVREEGVESLRQAYEDDVFGIPYLRWGRHRFWGYDRLDAFLGAWPPGVPAEPVEAGPELVGVPSYDTDTAGGCG